MATRSIKNKVSKNKPLKKETRVKAVSAKAVPKRIASKVTPKRTAKESPSKGIVKKEVKSASPVQATLSVVLRGDERILTAAGSKKLLLKKRKQFEEKHAKR